MSKEMADAFVYVGTGSDNLPQLVIAMYDRCIIIFSAAGCVVAALLAWTVIYDWYIARNDGPISPFLLSFHLGTVCAAHIYTYMELTVAKYQRGEMSRADIEKWNKRFHRPTPPQQSATKA